MNKLTLGIVVAFFSVSANASWSIVDIKGLNGNSFYASSINDSGQIAGSFNDNSTSLWHAFLTDANGANIKDIGSADNTSVTAGQINNIGQVIVQYLTPPEGDNVEIKYLITESNGNKTVLSTISAINGHANDINDSGVVTGHYFSFETGFHSFVTGSDPNYIKDIGTISGAAPITTAINNPGQMVGYSFSESGRTHAFITNSDGSGIRDLSVPGEKYYKSSLAYDINDSGQAAGILSTDNHRWTQAFITGDDGAGMVKLGTLPGHFASYAVAINDEGQAVGMSSVLGDLHPGLSEAFIYTNGGLTSLSTLPEVIDAGWSTIVVTDINNNGQIVGWGYQDSDPGNRHAFLLTFTSDTEFTPQDFYVPNIPEPSTYLMLLAGLGLLGFVGRKSLN